MMEHDNAEKAELNVILKFWAFCSVKDERFQLSCIIYELSDFEKFPTHYKMRMYGKFQALVRNYDDEINLVLF